MRARVLGVVSLSGLLSGCIQQVDIKEADLGVFPPDGSMALRGDVPILVHGTATEIPSVTLDIGGKLAEADCSGGDPFECEVPGGNTFGAPTVVEVSSSAGVDVAEVTTLVPVGEAMTTTGRVDVEHFGRFGIGKDAVADMLSELMLTGVLADTAIGPAFLLGVGERDGDVVELASPGLTCVLPVSWDGASFVTTTTNAWLPVKSGDDIEQLRFYELVASGEVAAAGFDYTLEGVIDPAAWAVMSTRLDLGGFGASMIEDVDTDGDGRGDTVSLRYSGHADDVTLLEWL